MKLVIATSNQGKVKEFREMLGSERFAWSDLSEHRSTPPVEETGRTFRENAALKAKYYATALDSWAMADDSGLEVDALNGAPGVHSARWAEINGAGKGDADNNALLLRQIQGIADAECTARFVCVLALSNPLGEIILTVRDVVDGRIIRTPRGANGFGYDPLFYFDVLGCTTAELPPEKKHSISHRGKALRRMRHLIDELRLTER